MLDPIILFIQNIFSAIGRGIGYVIAWILFPFMSAGRWYASRGFILKGVVGIVVVLLIIAYGHFVWVTQAWTGFNPDYVTAYKFEERKLPAGKELPGEDAAAPKKCQPSAIVEVTADLVDYEVNQNAWITSMPLYKLGLFGIDWDNTPWLDNKASFQRGINKAVGRTAIELVDTLARVRATSGINRNLQDAKQNLQTPEGNWYFGTNPVGFRTPTPEIYSQAIKELRNFNIELSNCQAVFDGRADNLLQFLDRVSNDLGATSSILSERTKNHTAGWFDTRADDRFWFAYGQMYGYYAILSAARVDFSPVIAEKNLGALWTQMTTRLREALDIQPTIVSNGKLDGWIMPSHLATQGFYLLNARNSLVDIRDVLDR